MPPDFWQGLYVTVAGMGLVFLSLGILMLAMLALGRVFRQPGPQNTAPKTTPAPISPSAEAETMVAALAVALTRSQRLATPGMRVITPKPTEGRAASAWSLVGRQRLMESRNLRGR